MSKVLRIYLDTSVFGGCFDVNEGWAEASNRLIDSFAPGRRTALVSAATLEELEGAPPDVQDVLWRLGDVELVTIDDEVRALAERFVEASVVPREKAPDALHVAAAILNRADILVSWNFKHLVNWEKKRRFGAIAMAEGYHPIEITNPWEVSAE